jgi:hypothetical protein
MPYGRNKTKYDDEVYLKDKNGDQIWNLTHDDGEWRVVGSWGIDGEWYDTLKEARDACRHIEKHYYKEHGL